MFNDNFKENLEIQMKLIWTKKIHSNWIIFVEQTPDKLNVYFSNRWILHWTFYFKVFSIENFNWNVYLINWQTLGWLDHWFKKRIAKNKSKIHMRNVNWF